MKLLVAGGDRVDAGKTTFSVGLLAHTGARGFKPRAGNNYWFDHDDYERATKEGRLYGKDARRLADASPGAVRPEAINAVHRLWHPSPGPSKGILGQSPRQFVVDRVGDSAGGRPASSRPAADDADGVGEFVVNGTVDIPDSAAERLPLDAAPRVTSLPDFNDLMAVMHAEALAALGETIAAADRAVVESYGDIARPLEGFEPDAVAVVEPGRARVYDGRRYAKACEIATGGPGEGQLEERVENVVDLIDRTSAVRLPALDKETRADPEAVADAYDHAYDALLAAAFD
ncbi:ATPase [Haloarcula sp. S1CR25-12]|uniref:ATPase n=1 Tax=Haloarcula saliterrae TaxID=2950534 RepID=A0ABU2F8W3_9EURY|nr:ATPase [Haloarcula sp. S1CR25-12]MDS0258733.1 ATPase [Haloarcula sp. S1CR25-12]